LFLSRTNPTSGGGRICTLRFFASIAFVRQRRRVESWYCHSVIGKQFGGRPCRPWLEKYSDTVWRLTESYLLGIVAEKGKPTLSSNGKWSLCCSCYRFMHTPGSEPTRVVNVPRELFSSYISRETKNYPFSLVCYVCKLWGLQ
jgi:hypothetical protein